MKREHSDLEPNPGPTSSGQPMAGVGSGKSKAWEEEEEVVDGMDELLAVLGYKVKTSDMAEVAQKLEQLEQAMMFDTTTTTTTTTTNDDYNYLNYNNFLDDTVHYNPSDLSTWLESMLSTVNDPSSSTSSTITTTTTTSHPPPSDYDLKAIPGKAVLTHSSPPSKRSKPSPSQPQATTSPSRPVVLVDSQENGIRLVHLLMACAEAVSSNNLALAETLVKQIRVLSLSQAGAMGKVATYFAEALARRIFQFYPSQTTLEDPTLSMHFYETCPYLKFAHFTANQAILEAFQGKTRLHVIDFSMNQGMQWPAFMQALALRPGGPPSFRLTGIVPPVPDNSDHLQEVGWKLAQLAETIGIEFAYRGFVANSLADLDSDILDLRPGESVAVNAAFELHKLLARPGAIQKVLSLVNKINPDVFTVAEQEASHNGPDFMTRFTASLHYYSTMFDSVDGSEGPEEHKVMAELYLGRQILNVVGCEGADRVERHERLGEWRDRIGSSGFDPVCLGSNAFKQASMLLALFGGGEGYRVEEGDRSLLLAWHTRPLIAMSAWRRDNTKKRLDGHQFDSNGTSGLYGQHAAKKSKLIKQHLDNNFDVTSPVAGSPSPATYQMSNMANTNKVMRIFNGHAKGRKARSLKISSGQVGSGIPWSTFEDQALVVLVHDMGPNWEIVGDAINSILQFKCTFRKPKECKERHRILMDKGASDGADGAEDSGSSQSYPSTLPGIPKDSARQLFQRLQGPVEEDTLKSHFGKIIIIGKRQHFGKSRIDHVDAKQLVPPHNSHVIALSQVCPNNLNGMILTPLDLCDIDTSNPDVPSLGIQGSHGNGLAIPNQGSPMHPTSVANSSLQDLPVWFIAITAHLRLDQ